MRSIYVDNLETYFWVDLVLRFFYPFLVVKLLSYQNFVLVRSDVVSQQFLKIEAL